MDSYIISENENMYLIKLERYEEILEYLGVKKFGRLTLQRWIKADKMNGLYDEKERFYGVYVKKDLYNSIFKSVSICDTCKYKDRLNIISDILNKGV